MRQLLRRRWPIGFVAAWAVLLLLLGFGAYGGDATVREQRDVATARRAVDRAAVALIRAAGQDTAVRVSGYELAEPCEVSLARDGAEFRRRVEFHPPPGREPALLTSISRRLPERYAARVNDGELTAAADGFVELRGTATHGVVRVELLTGCRPFDEPVMTLRTPPTEAERARVDGVLRLVGVDKAQPTWRTETVGCGGGAIREVDLTLAATPARPVGDAAGLVPPDARVLVREEHRLAYRRGGVSVVAESRDGTLRVTRTVIGC